MSQNIISGHNMIFNKLTKRDITVNSRNHKLYNFFRNDFNSVFGISDKDVVINNKGIPKLITIAKARGMINKGQLNPNDIYGNYSFKFEDNKPKIQMNIEKPIEPSKEFEGLTNKEVKEDTLKKIQKNRKNVVVYNLEEDDFYRYNLIYKIVKDFDLFNKYGEGTFVYMRGNEFLGSDEVYFNEFSSISKWWKAVGAWIGLIDSDTKAWHSWIVKNDKFKVLNLKSKNIQTKNDLVNFEEKLRTKAVKQRVKIIFIPAVEIAGEYLSQTYKNNKKNNCFFVPIEAFLNNLIERSEKASKTNKNYKYILNKVYKLEEQYNEGVNEEDIQDISNLLGINFEIHSPYHVVMDKTFKKFVSNKKKPLTTIKFINSRLNHLEKMNLVNLQGETINVDEEELKKIIIDNSQDGKIAPYFGSFSSPVSCFIDDKIYKNNKYDNDEILEFNNELKIFNYALDINNKKEREIISFLHRYYKIFTFNHEFKNLNLCDLQKLEKECYEYDMRKGYTQFKKCEQYIGFPTIMSNVQLCGGFTLDDIREKLGYYCIHINKIKNEKKNFLYAIGFKENKSIVLSSPEILFFSEFIEFTVISGTYSVKSIDIEFNEEFIDKKLYSKWVGKLGSINQHRSINALMTEQDAQMLANDFHQGERLSYKDVIQFDTDLKDVNITYKKEKCFCYLHIAGFFTSYCRINIFKEMIKLHVNELVLYKLDSFITTKKLDDVLDPDMWYVNDERKRTKLNYSGWLESGLYECLSDKKTLKIKEKYNEVFIKERLTLLQGGAGSGKTHKIFNSLGDDIMYLSLEWSLAVEKNKEYGFKAMSLHRFLGIQCDGYLSKNKPPRYIFLDEITKVNRKFIDELIKQCPYSFIILAGDIVFNNDDIDIYQCLLKDVVVYKNFKDFDIKNFNENKRAKEEDFKEFLIDLRRIMKETDFNVNKITEFVLEKLNDKIINIDRLKELYDYKKDYILCSTTDESLEIEPQTKFYTDLFDENKFLCVKHNAEDIYKKLNGEEAFLKGEITFENVNNNKFEKRHAFTIHSTQGKTLKDCKIFIDVNRLFCPRQLYTALSRAEYLNQIYLIK